MCVAALAWSAHPRWLLVAIGNRDEYHDRPAAPLAAWSDGSGMLAGRDLRSGGTWLGVSDVGRFALVTNRRGAEAADPAKASRGALVTDMLRGGDPARVDPESFNPFNLIVADTTQAQFLTNRPDPLHTPLAHGIYGLSNGALDAPWAKTLHLKAALLDWLNAGDDDFAPLFTALRSETLPQAGIHPREPSDVPIEPADTPPFIRHPTYGTRCSTVVAIGRDGAGTIAERRFSAAGEEAGETRLAFGWPLAIDAPAP